MVVAMTKDERTILRSLWVLSVLSAFWTGVAFGFALHG